MERKTSRNLYLIGILLAVVGVILSIAGAASGLGGLTAAANSDATGGNVGLAGFGILTIIAFAALIIAGILGLIAWVGALIKTARLSQWLWFVLLIILSWTGIMMLIYIFAGPTEAKLPVAV